MENLYINFLDEDEEFVIEYLLKEFGYKRVRSFHTKDVGAGSCNLGYDPKPLTYVKENYSISIVININSTWFDPITIKQLTSRLESKSEECCKDCKHIGNKIAIGGILFLRWEGYQCGKHDIFLGKAEEEISHCICNDFDLRVSTKKDNHNFRRF